MIGRSTEKDKEIPVQIRDRTFLVTGGGSGLGLATAGVLAQAGGNVLLVDINASAGQQAAIDLENRTQVLDAPVTIATLPFRSTAFFCCMPLSYSVVREMVVREMVVREIRTYLNRLSLFSQPK